MRARPRDALGCLVRLTLLVLLSVSLLPLAAAQMPLVIANYVGQSSQQVTQTTVNATSLLLSCDGTTAIFYGNDRAGKPPQAVNEGVWVVPTNLFRAQAMSVPGSKLADMIGATTDSQYVLFRVNETALFATQLSSPTDTPVRLSPAGVVGPISGAQTQLAAARCGCSYSTFTSPDARKAVFGVDGKILFRVGASSAIQVLTAAEGAAPYTLQSIGNTGFLAIASPALLFVPYVNPATASVLLSPAGVVADPVGALFCADEKNVVWMQDDGLWASSVTGAQSKLTDAANVTMFQCSPDSKTVVFLSNGELYAVAVTGAGGPVKLSPEMAVVAPSDSATGALQVGVVNTFVFVSGDAVVFTAQTLAGVNDLSLASQLYLVSVTNLTLVQLAAPSEDYPVLSPAVRVSCDGHFAVYSASIVNVTDRVALFSIPLSFQRANSTVALNLSPEDATVVVPWPDGVRISFDSQYVAYASVSAESGGNQCVYTRALRSPGVTLQATNILPDGALGVYDAVPFSLDMLVWRSEAREALAFAIMRNKASAALLRPVVAAIALLLCMATAVL